MILKQTGTRKSELAELRALRDANEGFNRSLVKSEIDRIEAGVEAEREVAHFLKREFGPSSSVLVINDLRIAHEGDHAQTDHMVIDLERRAMWIIETKGYSGILGCNAHGDWSVTYERKGEIQIDSPEEQCRRHCTTIARWMAERGLPEFEMIPMVAVASKTGIRRLGMNAGCDVIKSYNLIKTIREHQSKRPVLSDQDTEHLTEGFRTMVASHTSPGPTNWKRKLGLRARPTGKRPQLTVHAGGRAKASEARRRQQGNRTSREGHAGAVAGVIVAILLSIYGVPKILTGMGEGLIKNSQASQVSKAQNRDTLWPTSFPMSGTVEWRGGGPPAYTSMAGQLQVWDQTGSGTSKVVRIRNANVMKMDGRNRSTPVATAYMAPDTHLDIKLPAGLYDVTVMTGRGWDPEDGFLQKNFAADYGQVIVNAGQPGIVAMGASDQKVTPIEVTDF